MNAPANINPSKTVQSILARDTIAELALDLSALAEIVANNATRASLPRLEKAIHGLRAGVLLIGQTFREAEAAEQTGVANG